VQTVVKNHFQTYYFVKCKQRRVIVNMKLILNFGVIEMKSRRGV